MPRNWLHCRRPPKGEMHRDPQKTNRTSNSGSSLHSPIQSLRPKASSGSTRPISSKGISVRARSTTIGPSVVKRHTSQQQKPTSKCAAKRPERRMKQTCASDSGPVGFAVTSESPPATQAQGIWRKYFVWNASGTLRRNPHLGRSRGEFFNQTLWRRFLKTAP